MRESTYLFIINTAKRTAALISLLLLISFSAAAQVSDNAATISGRVLDSLSHQPINYVTISLLQGDNAVSGATSDDNGMFKLMNVAPGSYKVQIYFIGYNTWVKNVVVKKKATVALGDIKLVNSGESLQAVTVTAEKSLIENKNDKMVYNVEKDITSQVGVATDVLRKVPQIEVDINGNVELQGNSNILFLIDGKPSTIFGNNIADVLQTIPASQIARIEVITNPGSKYDAEGTAGIINIILKKSTVQGINGSTSLTAGTTLENGSFNLNARHGTFGVRAFVSGNEQLYSTINTYQNRLSMDSATATESNRLIQNGATDFNRGGYQGGGGFDWDITPQNNISGSVVYNYGTYNSTGLNNRQFITQDESGNPISSYSDIYSTANTYNWRSFNYSLNYKKTFKKTKDQSLDILYNSSISNTFGYYQQVQQYISPDSIYAGSQGSNPGISTQTDISADYVQPLPNDVTIETGAKVTLNQIVSTSDIYLLNTLNDSYGFNAPESSALNYKRSIYAYYLSGSFKFYHLFDVKAGLRDEYTTTNAIFYNAANVNIAPYNTLVPSITLSKTLKNYQTFRLSYSRRIQRPSYGDLDPFINASDPENIYTGNPNLQPEIADKIELGYNKTYEKGTNLFVSLFYRDSRQDIQPYLTYYPTYQVGDSTYSNVSVTTRENIGSEQDYGLNIYTALPVTTKLNIHSNLSGFQRYIYAGSLGGNVEGFNYHMNVNATYQIDSTLVVEAFGNFNSTRVNVEGTYPAWTSYNIAIRKQLFHKNGSIALTASDPFSAYVSQKTELTGQNFTLYNLREYPYRSFGVNFTYKFGKLEFKKVQEQPEDKDNPDTPVPDKIEKNGKSG